jgi:hypothetical protein
VQARGADMVPAMSSEGPLIMGTSYLESPAQEGVTAAGTVVNTSTVKALILRRICHPQCSGIKCYISSSAPIHSTE